MLVYLPALVMILRRPNEGELPASVERLVAFVLRRPATLVTTRTPLAPRLIVSAALGCWVRSSRTSRWWSRRNTSRRISRGHGGPRACSSKGTIHTTSFRRRSLPVQRRVVLSPHGRDRDHTVRAAGAAYWRAHFLRALCRPARVGLTENARRARELPVFASAPFCMAGVLPVVAAHHSGSIAAGTPVPRRNETQPRPRCLDLPAQS